MKVKVRRKYIGSQVVACISQEMGQPFGRVRMMPAEAATRQELSRWHGQQYAEAKYELSLEAVRMISVPQRRRPLISLVVGDPNQTW